ncbi:hypothetical protein JXA84_08915 [candidate division WOR-3 bacterium]|nr:hypothetical protein [candidate division WOR-3 bacterium]
MLANINLSVKCPKCGKSLMDPEHMINGQPSVLLDIVFEGKKSCVWLSSVYGDYSHDIGIDMDLNKTADFFCPKCGANLAEDFNCSFCGALMCSLGLEQGGLVNFCTRRGCKNHSLEFKDLEHVAKMFEDKFGWAGDTSITIDNIKSSPKKEVISSGAYLYCYCPFCERSLNEKNTVKLKVSGNDGTEGFLYLDPHLNSFSHKSTIELPDKEEVSDLKCPHCDHTLILDEPRCSLCSARTASFKVSAMTKLVDFIFCTRKNCHWHSVSDKDLELIELEDSLEW